MNATIRNVYPIIIKAYEISLHHLVSVSREEILSKVKNRDTRFKTQTIQLPFITATFTARTCRTRFKYIFLFYWLIITF